MKKSLLLFLVCTGLSLRPATAQTAQTVAPARGTFSNPLKVQFGDPYVLYTKGTYYMYGTGGGAEKGFAAYSSKDMVNWKAEGQVYFHDNKNGWSDPKASWGGAYWAPEVYQVRGKFYLFYSAQWRENPKKEEENFRIGVAVADKPTGPFVDMTNRPIFDPGYPIIDANVFFDTDGKAYLYYSRAAYKHPVESEVAALAQKKGWYKEIEESWVYGVELKPDFSGVVGQPVLVLRPPVRLGDKQAEWESRSVTAREVNRRWTEGSVTFKKDNTYYIMYSANHFGGQHYAIGYATARSPLGPVPESGQQPGVAEEYRQRGPGVGHGAQQHCLLAGRQRNVLRVPRPHGQNRGRKGGFH
jgi:beta-xylosidase